MSILYLILMYLIFAGFAIDIIGGYLTGSGKITQWDGETLGAWANLSDGIGGIGAGLALIALGTTLFGWAVVIAGVVLLALIPSKAHPPRAVAHQ